MSIFQVKKSIWKKTAIFFNKIMKEDKRLEILRIWGAQVTTQYEKFLGMPAMVGRSKEKAFAGLKNPIARRLQGWNEKIYVES